MDCLSLGDFCVLRFYTAFTSRPTSTAAYIICLPMAFVTLVRSRLSCHEANNAALHVSGCTVDFLLSSSSRLEDPVSQIVTLLPVLQLLLVRHHQHPSEQRTGSVDSHQRSPTTATPLDHREIIRRQLCNTHPLVFGPPLHLPRRPTFSLVHQLSLSLILMRWLFLKSVLSLSLPLQLNRAQ